MDMGSNEEIDGDVNEGRWMSRSEVEDGSRPTHRCSKVKLPGMRCMASHSMVAAKDDKAKMTIMLMVGVSQPAC